MRNTYIFFGILIGCGAILGSSYLYYNPKWDDGSFWGATFGAIITAVSAISVAIYVNYSQSASEKKRFAQGFIAELTSLKRWVSEEKKGVRTRTQLNFSANSIADWFDVPDFHIKNSIGTGIGVFDTETHQAILIAYHSVAKIVRRIEIKHSSHSNLTYNVYLAMLTDACCNIKAAQEKVQSYRKI